MLEATGAAATHNPNPASARNPCGSNESQSFQHSRTSYCSTSQHQTSDSYYVHTVHSVDPPPSVPVSSISITSNVPSTPVSTNSVSSTSTQRQTAVVSNPPYMSNPFSSSSSYSDTTHNTTVNVSVVSSGASAHVSDLSNTVATSSSEMANMKEILVLQIKSQELDREEQKLGREAATTKHTALIQSIKDNSSSEPDKMLVLPKLDTKKD